MEIGNQIARLVKTFETPFEGESITVKGETFIRERDLHHSKGPMYLALKIDMHDLKGLLVVNDDEIIIPLEILKGAYDVQRSIYRTMQASAVQTAINALDEVEGDDNED